MIENTDFACIINKEYKATSNTTYMTFKEIKSRSKSRDNDVSYFAHPYSKENRIKLIEDFAYKNPISLLSLSNDSALDTNKIMETRRGNISGRNNGTVTVKRQMSASDLIDDFDIADED